MNEDFAIFLFFAFLFSLIVSETVLKYLKTQPAKDEAQHQKYEKAIVLLNMVSKFLMIGGVVSATTFLMLLQNRNASLNLMLELRLQTIQKHFKIPFPKPTDRDYAQKISEIAWDQ
jgi:hypothetical protein